MAEVDEVDDSSAKLEHSFDADGRLVLSIIGEIDLSNVDRADFRDEAGYRGSAGRYRFDLADLLFMDSSGLALLFSVAERTGAVEVRNPSPVVRRMIGLTSVSNVLRVLP